MTPTEIMHRAMPFTAVMGIEAIASDKSEVRARVAWDPSRCTTAGVLHGGLLMALADTVGATVAFLNLPDGAVGTVEGNEKATRSVQKLTSEDDK